ncbi:MAG TPA: GTPase ObgE [Acidimicrobiaceae bacterium]|nr:GTPase ObgE [Acidimicrobiaceae bacterium]
MPAFVDEAQIHAKAGDGGAGAVSFRREAHVARGGPDGGDGGRGGDVWLEASVNEASLLGFRDHPHRRAGDGGHGRGNKRRGAAGADLVVPVPVGTVVRGPGGVLLADLDRPGDRVLVAGGGRGGGGNARFLANRRRAPAFAEQGEKGEERWLDLELKLAADVALVGLPNAGKSTLIARISAAKPKIADYPFTTLEPHLGVVRVGRPGDETEFVVADVPGLVEGAAEGRGLGHRFLRHVERARVLVVLLDVAALEGRSTAEQQRVLLDELARYRPELLERPRLVVESKADLLGPAEHAEKPDIDDGAHALRVSAVTGQGVDELVGRLAVMVAEAREAEVAAAEGPIVVHRPLGDTAIDVSRLDDGSFLVEGRAALRAVALSDLTDDDALAVVQQRLRRLGVERALRRAGIRDGDTVHVGELGFTYESEGGALNAAADVEASSRQPGGPRRTTAAERKGTAS